MRAPAPLLRLPTHVLNGATVALGIGLVQALVGVWAGPAATLSAVAGAVYASLADLPNPPHRGWRRMVMAAAFGLAATLLVLALRPFPLALGLAAGLIGFASVLTLAWGARAGPISFVGVLAFVYTMARPPPIGATALLVQIGWTAAGAALYLAWALLVARLLQRRYRTLALATALAAIASLLRSRAAVLAGGPRPLDDELLLQTWIDREGALDERLQAARDLLFAAPDTEAASRETSLLVLAIDLRDTLLLGALDLELLGDDAAGKRLRHALAAALRRIAEALDAMDAALRLAQPLPASEPPHAGRRLGDGVFDQDDARQRLLPLLDWRLRHMRGDVAQMRRLLHGASATLPLARDELSLFVSPEGWPLAALRRHLQPQSPVLRHALRTGIAMASAWTIGLALPWASHAHWLVLTVAVVLRGSLDETLARRNERVAGTAIGCLLVLGLAQLGAPWLAGAVFLVAAGVAHAYVMRRYLVTAAAGTVMALLQVQLADALDGLDGLAVAERLADTVLGALLAWAFSYMLPSWQRQRLPRLVERLMRALSGLAEQALRLGSQPRDTLELRLARREVYDALGAVAAAAARSAAEPPHVRVAPQAYAAVLTHSDALVAHLAAIKLMLARRPADFDEQQALVALRQACDALQRWLADTPQAPVAAAAAASDAEFVPPLPAQAPAETLLPWLQRRLRLAAREAARLAEAVAALQAVARGVRRDEAATSRL